MKNVGRSVLCLFALLLFTGLMASSVAAQAYWVDNNNNLWTKTNITAGVNTTLYIQKTPGYSPNGSGVFDFFDGFDGSTLDTNKWTVGAGSATVSGSNATISSDATIYTTPTFGVNYTAMWRGSQTVSSGTYVGWQKQTSPYERERFTSNVNTISSENYVNGASQTTIAGYSGGTSTFEIRRRNTTDAQYVIDGTVKVTDVNQLYTSAQPFMLQRSGSGTIVTDWMAVRKYNATEPTVSAATTQTINGNTYYMVNVTSNTNLTGYQVNLSNSYGISASNDSLYVDTGTRETAANPYWIDNTNSLWVKTSVKAGTNTTLYIQKTGSYSPNGNNVFELYDGFDGASVDSTKWTSISAGTLSVANGIFTTSASSSNVNSIYSKNTYGVNYSIITRSAVTQAQYGWLGFTPSAWGATTAGSIQYNGGSGFLTITKPASVAENHAILSPDANYHTYEIARNGSTSTIFSRDGSILNTHSTQVSSANNYVEIGSYNSGGSVSTDWIAVKKRAMNEPTVSTTTQIMNGSTYYVVNITSGTDLSDYQVNLSNVYGLSTPIDSVRINDVVPTPTVKPYWIDESNNLWARTSVKVGINTTLYVQKKSGYIPSGSQVFDFYDGFDSNTLDASKWSTVGTGPSISSGILSVTGSGSSNGIQSKSTFGTNVVVEGRNKFNTYGGSIYAVFGLDDNTNSNYIDIIPPYTATGVAGYYSSRNGAGATSALNLGLASIDATDYQTWKIVRLPGQYIIYENSVQRANYNTAANIPTINLPITVWGSSASLYEYSDWVRTRKYNATEPTVSVIPQIINGSAYYVVNISSNTDLTDYQVNLGNSYSLSSVNDSVYVNDTAPVIIEQQKPYWIDNTNSLWTKTSVKAGVPTTLYIQKTNGYTPNGNNVFEFYDGFDGTTLDTTKFERSSTGGSTTVSNGVCTVTGGAAAWEGIGTLVTFGANYDCMSRFKASAEANHWQCGWGALVDGPPTAIVVNSNGQSYLSTTGSQAAIARPTAYTDYVTSDIIRNGGTQNIFKSNGIVEASPTTGVTSTPMKMGYYANGRTITVDYVAVRKYNATEPTVSVAPQVVNGTTYYAVTINSNTDLADYQVNLSNVYGLTSVNDSVYVNTTAPVTTQQKPYWIDNTNSLWTKTSVKAGVPTTLYIQKTNGYAPNGTQTFDFFDDFNAINTSDWTVTGSVASANSIATVTGSDAYNRIKSTRTYPVNETAEFYGRITTAGSVTEGFGFWVTANTHTAAFTAGYPSASTLNAYSYVSSPTGTDLGTSYAGGYARYKIARNGTANKYSINNVLLATHTTNVMTDSLAPLDIFSYANGAFVRVNWVAMHKYNETEPTVSTTTQTINGNTYYVVTINSNTDLTDYQVNLSNPCGITGDNDSVYINAAAPASRPYWIDNSNNVWAKTNLTAGVNTTLYVRKTGNYTPDGNNVFDFYDGFDGAAVDTNKWTSYTDPGATITVSGGECTFYVPTTNGAYGQLIAKTDPVQNNEMWESRAKQTAGYGGANVFVDAVQSSATPIGTAYRSATGYVTLVQSSVAWGSNLATYTNAQYNVLSSAYDGTNLIGLFNRGTSISWARTQQTQHGELLAVSSGATGTYVVDYALARKYNVTEPTVSPATIQTINGIQYYVVNVTSNTTLTNYQVNLSNPFGVTSATDSVYLTDIQPDNSSQSQQPGVNVTPTANFIANVTTGLAPLNVQFTDQSTGSPTSWSYDFGDGHTSTDPNPVYTYTQAGTFNVSLTATNANGSNVSTKYSYIIVTTAPPNITSATASNNGALNLINNSITYAVTADNTNTITWYLDGFVNQTDNSNSGQYIFPASTLGVHNITAIASSNTNAGISSHTWNIEVTPNSAFRSTSLKPVDLFTTTYTANATLYATGNMSWYVNGVLLQNNNSTITSDFVLPASYTNVSYVISVYGDDGLVTSTVSSTVYYKPPMSNYYIDDSNTVWLNDSLGDASNKTYYIRTNQASVTQNPWGIFPLYENFDDGGLNTTLWNGYKVGHASDVYDPTFGGNFYLRAMGWGNEFNGYYANGKIQIPVKNVTVLTRIEYQPYGSGSSGVYLAISNNSQPMKIYGDQSRAANLNIMGSTVYSDNNGPGAYHKINVSLTDTTVNLKEDGAQAYNSLYSPYQNNTGTISFYGGRYGGADSQSAYSYIDYILVANYTSAVSVQVTQQDSSTYKVVVNNQGTGIQNYQIPINLTSFGTLAQNTPLYIWSPSVIVLPLNSQVSTLDNTSQTFNMTSITPKIATWYLDNNLTQTNYSTYTDSFTTLPSVGIHNVTLILTESGTDTFTHIWELTVNPRACVISASISNSNSQISQYTPVTYSVTSNYTDLTKWYLNGQLVQSNVSSNDTSYVFDGSTLGTDVVTAVVSNAYSSDTYAWTTFVYPTCAILSTNTTHADLENLQYAPITYNVTSNNTDTTCWYVDGVLNQTNVSSNNATFAFPANFVENGVNVTVIVNNSYTSDSHTWFVNVIPAVRIISHGATDMSNNISINENVVYNITSQYTDIAQWYVDDSPVQVNLSDNNAAYAYTATSLDAHNVSVVVSNNVSSDRYSWNLTVYPLANAGFSTNLSIGLAPLTVQFTDNSTSTTQWLWQFGDGQTSTEKNPSHTYTNGNWTYAVSLCSSNPANSNVMTNASCVTVFDPVPVANFTSNVTSGHWNFNVLFNDLSLGNNITGYNWSFGDGLFSAEQNPTHMYTALGIYDIILNVTNNGGSHSVSKFSYMNVYDPICSIVSSATNNSTHDLPINTCVNFTETSANAWNTAWYVNSQPVQWNNGSNASSFVYTFNTLGAQNITCIVNNTWNSDVKTWNYYTYTPCVITSASRIPDTNDVLNGTPITYHATATTVNHIRWYVNGEMKQDDPTNSSTYVSPSDVTGVMNVTVIASNDYSTDSRTWSTTVRPVAVITSHSTDDADGNLIEDVGAGFTIDTQNADTVDWYYNGVGGTLLKHDTNKNEYTLAYNAPILGAANITVVAANTWSSDSYKWNIRVYPVCHITSADATDSSLNLAEDEAVTYSITDTDAQNVTWYLDGEPIKTEGAVNASEYNYVASSLDYHNITVIIDNPVSTDSHTWNIKTFPIVKINEFDQTNYAEHLQIDKPVTYSIISTNGNVTRWYVNGEVVQENATDFTHYVFPANVLGVYNITAIVSNDYCYDSHSWFVEVREIGAIPYYITKAEFNTEPVVNGVTATGAYNGTSYTSSTVTSTVLPTLVPSPSLSLVKTASPTNYSASGQTITYSYNIVNTGNVPLDSVVANDDGAVMGAQGSTLNPGDSVVYTGTHTTTPNEVVRKSITASANATGMYNGQTISSVLTKTVVRTAFVPTPSLAAIVTANPTVYNAYGQVITYSYTVINTGNVPLSNIAVHDNTTKVTINSGTLAPGAKVSGTASQAMQDEYYVWMNVSLPRYSYQHINVVLDKNYMANPYAVFPYFSEFDNSSDASNFSQTYNTAQDYTGVSFKNVTNGTLHLGFNNSTVGSSLVYANQALQGPNTYVLWARYKASGIDTELGDDGVTPSTRNQKEIGLTHSIITPTVYLNAGSGSDYIGWQNAKSIGMEMNSGQSSNLASLADGNMTTSSLTYTVDNTSTYHPSIWIQHTSPFDLGSEIWLDALYVQKIADVDIPIDIGDTVNNATDVTLHNTIGSIGDYQFCVKGSRLGVTSKTTGLNISYGEAIWSPDLPVVEDYEPTVNPQTSINANQNFSATFSQIGDVYWSVDNAQPSRVANVMTSDYMISSSVAGRHSVTAAFSNENGSVAHSWDWTVIENGTFHVESVPSGSTVTINGTRYDDRFTPCDVEVPQGWYNVTISNPDYHSNTSYYYVSATLTTNVSMILDPIPGSLNVTSNLTGAKIYLGKFTNESDIIDCENNLTNETDILRNEIDPQYNGNLSQTEEQIDAIEMTISQLENNMSMQQYNVTPATIPYLVPGVYLVSLRSPDYRNSSTVFTVAANRTTFISPTIYPLPGEVDVMLSSPTGAIASVYLKNNVGNYTYYGTASNNGYFRIPYMPTTSAYQMKLMLTHYHDYVLSNVVIAPNSTVGIGRNEPTVYHLSMVPALGSVQVNARTVNNSRDIHASVSLTSDDPLDIAYFVGSIGKTSTTKSNLLVGHYGVHFTATGYYPYDNTTDITEGHTSVVTVNMTKITSPDIPPTSHGLGYALVRITSNAPDSDVSVGIQGDSDQTWWGTTIGGGAVSGIITNWNHTYTVAVANMDYFDRAQNFTFHESATLDDYNNIYMPLVPRNGSIIVKTQPEGANVYVKVNGIDVLQDGVTPLTVSDVYPGSYPVTVRMDGYIDNSTTVIVPINHSTEWDAQMYTPAFLHITTAPTPASIYIDGQYYGQSPIENITVPSGGDHQIVARVYQNFQVPETAVPGYYDTSRTVTFEAYNLTNVHIPLDSFPGIGTLNLSSIPNGMRYYMNGGNFRGGSSFSGTSYSPMYPYHGYDYVDPDPNNNRPYYTGYWDSYSTTPTHIQMYNGSYGIFMQDYWRNAPYLGISNQVPDYYGYSGSFTIKDGQVTDYGPPMTPKNGTICVVMYYPDNCNIYITGHAFSNAYGLTSYNVSNLYIGTTTNKTNNYGGQDMPFGLYGVRFQVPTGKYYVVARKSGYGKYPEGREEFNATVEVPINREAWVVDRLYPALFPGTLHITTFPNDASIAIDGVYQANGPDTYISNVTCTVPYRDPTIHHVTVSYPGYTSRTLPFYVGNGSMTTMRVPLYPDGTSSGHGMLSLMTEPDDSSVTIDGESMPNAPLWVDLVAGQHTLSVTHGNEYTPYSGTFQITQDEITNKSIVLDKKNGFIAVNVQPAGAQIWINGQLQQYSVNESFFNETSNETEYHINTYDRTTPYTFEERPGSYVVKITRPFYSTILKTVTVLPTETITISDTMTKYGSLYGDDDHSQPYIVVSDWLYPYAVNAAEPILLNMRTNSTADNIFAEVAGPNGFEYFGMTKGEGLLWNASIAPVEPGNYTLSRYVVIVNGIMHVEPSPTQSSFEVYPSVLSGPLIPQVDFTASPKFGNYPLSVFFADLSFNNPISWYWDFGDGTNSVEQNPTHVYTQAGTYTVSLTAANNLGQNTTTKEDYIVAQEPSGTAAKVLVRQNTPVKNAIATGASISVTRTSDLFAAVTSNVTVGYQLASLMVLALVAAAIMRFLGFL